MLRIAVDAAGGDYYPKHPVEGSILAVNERSDIHIILLGPADEVNKELAASGYSGNQISVVDAPEIIGMDDSPSMAVKSKQKSSIVMGLGMHAQQHCDAFASAGNTGALLAASAFILGRLPGVIRPTISSYYPTINGFRLMVDVGANLEVKPDMLYQFALMGEVFAREVMGIQAPRIGLLNVGEEEEKGTDTIRAAYSMLKKHPGFVGNIEGRDILACKADVYLCDGFTGNVVLKFGESIPEAIQHMIKMAVGKMKLPEDMIKPVFGVLREALAPFDYEAVGGVPFLGVNGVSFVGHGGSSPVAIKNMILKASRMVRLGVNEKIIAAIH